MSQSKHYNRTGPTGPKEPHGTYFFALPSRTTGLVTKRNNNWIVLKLISCFFFQFHKLVKSSSNHHALLLKEIII